MKTKLLWIQGLACNGNAHSFLNYRQLVQFLEDFTFVHHPVIDSSLTLEEVFSEYYPTDILLIEGAIAEHFTRAGEEIISVIERYAPHVKKIVTIGRYSTNASSPMKAISTHKS